MMFSSHGDVWVLKHCVQLGLERHCDTRPEKQTDEENSFALDDVSLKGENPMKRAETLSCWKNNLS